MGVVSPNLKRPNGYLIESLSPSRPLGGGVGLGRGAAQGWLPPEELRREQQHADLGDLGDRTSSGKGKFTEQFSSQRWEGILITSKSLHKESMKRTENVRAIQNWSKNAYGNRTIYQQIKHMYDFSAQIMWIHSDGQGESGFEARHFRLCQTLCQMTTCMTNCTTCMGVTAMIAG